MKRFYAEASPTAEGAILLDGRPVRTPARAALALPTSALAAAVAAEWAAQGDAIDPRAMPLTGIANAAIDRVAPAPAAFAAPLAAYASTDLLCYRASEPAGLAMTQAEMWDPPLDWARARYDVTFAVTSGIVPVTQPPATVERLRAALLAQDAFRLAALAPLVTIGGSLVTALALTDGAVTAEAAFDLTHLDETWQASQWGEDTLATQVRAARRTDFLAASQFLSLLGPAGRPAASA